ncbi:type III pantothenate kinase [Anaerolineales bacterium]
MLLAIDIGNTNIHLGLWQNQTQAWRLSWRARTVADKMPDEYGVLVRNFLSSAGVEMDHVKGIVIGSVVPRLTVVFKEISQRYFQLMPIIVNATINLGIRIEIDNPQEAGADRLINAAAVKALYDHDAIVLDFGTATTFDVVRNGAYQGGAIAPGINLAHDALVKNAARLYKIDLEAPPSAIGKNTVHAMQSGIFWGYVGLLEGITARIKNELDEDIKVIGTGGLAPLFNNYTNIIDFIAPELTLDGLRVIYELNL